jgi:hypothetical protein
MVGRISDHPGIFSTFPEGIHHMSRIFEELMAARSLLFRTMFPALTVVLLTACTRHPHDPAISVSLLSFGQSDELHLPVEVNGMPGHMLVDTCGSTSFILEHLASRLNVTLRESDEWGIDSSGTRAKKKIWHGSRHNCGHEPPDPSRFERYSIPAGQAS